MHGGRYKMGDKYVQVDGADLIVDGKRYIGTQGLWSLIMRKNPEDYSHEDLMTRKQAKARGPKLKGSFLLKIVSSNLAIKALIIDES